MAPRDLAYPRCVVFGVMLIVQPSALHWILLKNSVLESIESELGLIKGSFSLLVATIGAR
jgi:hypothetical protein